MNCVNHEFRGVAVPERQRWIWNRLRDKFGEDATQVSLVVAYSPDEWEDVGTRAAG
jgi:acid stress-induced BolA-like protein IbaG/YrbA